jgi:hypothetical protein
VPELEFGQSSDEGTELVIILGGKGVCVAIFQPLVLGERRVELWLKESEEEVEKINAQRIGN